MVLKVVVKKKDKKKISKFWHFLGQNSSCVQYGGVGEWLDYQKS